MSQSSPEGINLGKESKLVSCNLSINEEKVFEYKSLNTVELLEEVVLQIEYLHSKFGETGSGNSVLSRLKTAIEKLNKKL